MISYYLGCKGTANQPKNQIYLGFSDVPPAFDFKKVPAILGLLRKRLYLCGVIVRYNLKT
jgi:hypothetical protein